MANPDTRMMKMTFNERESLNPFEKWKRFGIFPWLFVVHLLLIGATSLHAISIVKANSNFSRV
jgi:hypothetical protein